MIILISITLRLLSMAMFVISGYAIGGVKDYSKLKVAGVLIFGIILLIMSDLFAGIKIF